MYYLRIESMSKISFNTNFFPSDNCAYERNNDASLLADSFIIPNMSGRLAPDASNNAFMFGFSLDWSSETPRSLTSKLGIGKSPAVFNAFVYINQTDFQADMIYWMAKETSYVGSILQLSMCR